MACRRPRTRKTYSPERRPPFTTLGSERINPTTGEAETKYGMPLDNDLWMKTKAFLPGSKAPQARQGTISSLANQMVVWARTGVPSA